MKNITLLSIFLFLIFISCKKKEAKLVSNAEVIGFVSEKCECCWGWIIKIGDETIKSDNIIIGELVGYEIIKPIKVYIELGDLVYSCSSYHWENPNWLLDYYNIKIIELVE
jgi:hypothetical protein